METSLYLQKIKTINGLVIQKIRFGIECSDTFETPVFLKAVNGAHVFIQQRDEGNKDIEDVNCWEFFHCEGDFLIMVLNSQMQVLN